VCVIQRFHGGLMFYPSRSLVNQRSPLLAMLANISRPTANSQPLGRVPPERYLQGTDVRIVKMKEMTMIGT
jgi:hypothetical protein